MIIFQEDRERTGICEIEQHLAASKSHVFAENLLAFTFAATLLTLTPGLDTALVLRTATVEGKQQAFRAAPGINAGCLLWGAAVAFGLGALIAVSELAFNLLKYCGAAYLAWLGLVWFEYALASTSLTVAR